MNERPSVSVIVPTYNRARLLLKCVDSVLAQTLPVKEIIVIDDGSTDDTAEELQAYLKKRPLSANLVRYQWQSNQGQSVALNHGIAMATSEWIAFHNSDDLWLPWKLEWQFRSLYQYGKDCELCFTDAWFMNNPYMKTTVFQHAEKELRGPLGSIKDPARLVVSRHPIWVQTVLAKADLVRRTGGFDPQLRYSEDHDFLFRMSLQTNFCYVSIPMVLIDRSPADIRHLGEAKNWHKVEYCLRMDQHRFEKQFQLGSALPVDVQETIRSNLRSLHSHWATCHLRNGDYANARQSMRTALHYDLTTGVAFKWMFILATPKLARKVLVTRDESGPPRYDRTSWDTV
jgi:glycosyltransferase involved in cell wall biosynthesis